ncbi:AraC family transcriptional regulator [Croceibacterium ferulae]|uniref:AraC family transcriptional regulator n=1 Tax=Croceibacterium ferulae TaxID=1854641 RepID=UPI000EB472E6|nr:AraC family transcriptional regulator [Croceibacterium ferulae]
MSDLPSTSEQLQAAVLHHAAHGADADGVVLTCVPGLRMMRACHQQGPMRSIYRPLICLVLQGAKAMQIGHEDRMLHATQAIIVAAHLPVTGQVVEATPARPYVALSIELDLALLHTLALEIGELPVASEAPVPIFSESLDATIIGCAARLMRLIDHPEAVAPLHPAIMRELHYWLLRSQHGTALRRLAIPSGNLQRLTQAITLLRENFREPVRIDRLASAANLSPSAFRHHFKQVTSLSPLQFQKQLRLAEARRLMMSEGMPAGLAALTVGYQSASHFSRDFVRMYGAPPKRDRVARGAPQPA